MTHRSGEEGVSEVVGVMLLVGLTVLAVAVVAVVLLSGPQPDEIPHATIVAGMNESGSFALVHEGGDPLRTGEYRIYIDAGSGLMDSTGNFTGLEGGVWSIGGVLTYTGGANLTRVIVTVLPGDGGETILAEVAFRGGGKTFSPDPTEPVPSPDPFVNYVINENVFVYGNALKLGVGGSGSSVVVTGPGATVVITGGLDTEDLKSNSFINVSNIYIDGGVTLDNGSNRLGSPTDPGNISINGDLRLMEGNMAIYGDVYVNGSCDLGGVTIHNNVYVNGDLTLRREKIDFVGDAHAYYTGTLNVLSGVDPSKRQNCTHRATVPGFTMPDLEIPQVKDTDWYADKGYDLSGDLTSNMKVFADNYSSTVWRHTATNVAIIASTGDITITGMGDNGVTGVFFAPNGKVTFGGKFFEGVVIARDGFFVEKGNTQVTFKNLNEYISDPEDYPF